MPLRKPPRNLGQIDLETENVSPAKLVRLSRYSSGEPHFARSAGNRFDDRSRPASGRFGTCYCGFDLSTAIAETVLHDAEPIRGKFFVSYADFERRFQVRFPAPTDDLVLVAMTDAQAKTLGADGAISTETPYRTPQLWAMALQRHPHQIDGVLYMSRHLNKRQAVVIFDRAKRKLGRAVYKPLPEVAGVIKAISALHISFDYP
jgi:hypothetical protein